MLSDLALGSTVVDEDSPPAISEADQVAELLSDARALGAEARAALGKANDQAPVEEQAPTDIATLLKQVDTLKAEAASSADSPPEAASRAPGTVAPSSAPPPANEVEYDDDSANDSPTDSDSDDGRRRRRRRR